jgi:putative membrane protein
MALLARLLINTLALIITTWIVPGFEINGVWTAVLAAIVLGVVNTFIRPLMLLITLPFNIITLGLFTFVINALMLWMTAYFVRGVHINDWLSAILAAIVLSVTSTVLGAILKEAKD